jgi:hypothetical protein
MAASHLQMLRCKLEGIQDETMESTSIYFDSKSAIAMGINYKDTKHTHHIMRWYHHVRQNIAVNWLTATWISNEIQIADIGTKLNDGPKHKVQTEMIMIKVKDQKQALIRENQKCDNIAYYLTLDLVIKSFHSFFL